MAQSAPDQARYLQEALAIARGTKRASPEEATRLKAVARLAEALLNALVWLEDVASSIPEHLYDQAGINGAVLHAREVIHAADGLTRSDEEQANLDQEREAARGPDLMPDELIEQIAETLDREKRNADEIASEFAEEPADAHRGNTP